MGLKHATHDRVKGDAITSTLWNAAHDDILIADIATAEFNVASKLPKLDANAYLLLAQIIGNVPSLDSDGKLVLTGTSQIGTKATDLAELWDKTTKIVPGDIGSGLGKAGASDEYISLGVIPLSIYTPQIITGTTPTKLKLIDNSTDLVFKTYDRPTPPTGMTLKGRLWAICAGTGGTGPLLEYYDDTGNAAIDSLSPTSAYLSTERSLADPFTFPDSSHYTSIKAYTAIGAGATVTIWAAWIEFLGVL